MCSAPTRVLLKVYFLSLLECHYSSEAPKVPRFLVFPTSHLIPSSVQSKPTETRFRLLTERGGLAKVVSLNGNRGRPSIARVR